MQPEKNSRMDTGELKAQLFKKVGQERFKRYFHCLNRFLNQKLSKSEFDKSCYRLLGRENLPLHNQLIKAIVKNACSAKTPPPQPHEAGPASKVGVAAGRNSSILEEGHVQGVGMGQHQNSFPPVLSNGVIPISSRKGRSTIRERKLIDRPSPLGPNGKVYSTSHQPTATDVGVKSIENGDLPSWRNNDDRDDSRFGARDVQNNTSRLKFSRSPLIAPLGIPFYSASTGVTHKTLPVTHGGDSVSCSDVGGLCDSDSLRRQMERISAAQGLGVTLECANTLNNMMDVHLKRLIRSCLDLVGSRSTIDAPTYSVQKQQIPAKPINGLLSSYHLHTQNSGDAVEAQRINRSVSLVDLKVAMELNPQQLGENWPLLLEKISMQGFGE